jgi:hypothetical protein
VHINENKRHVYFVCSLKCLGKIIHTTGAERLELFTNSGVTNDLALRTTRILEILAAADRADEQSAMAAR